VWGWSGVVTCNNVGTVVSLMYAHRKLIDIDPSRTRPIVLTSKKEDSKKQKHRRAPDPPRQPPLPQIEHKSQIVLVSCQNSTRELPDSAYQASGRSTAVVYGTCTSLRKVAGQFFLGRTHSHISVPVVSPPHHMCITSRMEHPRWGLGGRKNHGPRLVQIESCLFCPESDSFACPVRPPARPDLRPMCMVEL
jgi:hypothetical protein